MSTSSSPPELKWNRFDALVALAVVLLAVVSALCFYLPKNQSGALTVVIDISGQEVRRVLETRDRQSIWVRWQRELPATLFEKWPPNTASKPAMLQ